MVLFKKKEEYIMTAYEAVYNVAGSKEKIILTLLKAGVKPKEVIEIKPNQLSEKGIKIGDKEYEVPFDVLKEYVGSQAQLIKNKSFLFPGKSTTQPNMKVNNIGIVLGKLAKQEGYTLDDLELGVKKEKYKKAPVKFENPQQMLEYFKNM